MHTTKIYQKYIIEYIRIILRLVLIFSTLVKKTGVTKYIVTNTFVAGLEFNVLHLSLYIGFWDSASQPIGFWDSASQPIHRLL